MGLSVIPSLRAPAWVARNSTSLNVGFQRTAKRDTLGAASFRSSSRFGPSSGTIRDTPVTLPPGRAKLATSPVVMGSLLAAITIGIVLLARCAAFGAASPPAVTITSTFMRISSSARSSNISGFHFAERYSIAIVFPSTHPSSRRPVTKAARSGDGLSVRGDRTRYPIRGILPACWASANGARRLKARTTASPISRMGTSVEDAGGECSRTP
jgi:hypothetical protein